MTVTLNIQNDEELRAYAKDLVRGQINRISREELVDMIKVELDRKVLGLDTQRFEQLMKQCFKDAIIEILRKDYKVMDWSNLWIKPYMDNYFNTILNGKRSEDLIVQIAKRLTDTK